MASALIIGPPFAEALPNLKGGLTLLVVSTAFASFLIPTTFLLFYFTPVRIWRSPLFIFNVLSIALGLTLQALYIYVIIDTTLVRSLPAGLVTLIVAMNFLVPISVQGVLLVRLIGVYPPSMNTWTQNLAIYVPVVAFKTARLVNAAYAAKDILTRSPGSLTIIDAARLVWSTKYVKVEWFLQLFDDMFVSGLFVHRLYASLMMRKDVNIDTGPSASGSGSGRYSWAERIRTLYYIAVSNFVFPILFNIAQLGVIFCDRNFYHGAVVVTVNCYVTIIGVLLATIWGQGSARGRPARFQVGFDFESRPEARGARGRNLNTTTTIALASLEFALRDRVLLSFGVDSVGMVEGGDGMRPKPLGPLRI